VSQAMKLDMSQAWNQAMAMLGANRDLIAIVAGVFFFLPYAAVVLMVPELSAPMPSARTEAEMQAAFEALLAVYAAIWPYLLVIVILQAIGSLTLLALLRDSARPTLGDALKLGVTGFLPYLAAQLIVGFAFSLIGGLAVGGAAALSQGLGILMMLIVIIALVYVMVKISLAMPVIGIERVYNPIAALRRSWRLTKGNSLRLTAFFALIVIAGWIITAVIGMIFGLVFALFGEQGALIGNALVGSLLNAAFVTVLLAVLAAAHRQLADAP
jgi:hypothetical protein